MLPSSSIIEDSVQNENGHVSNENTVNSQNIKRPRQVLIKENSQALVTTNHVRTRGILLNPQDDLEPCANSLNKNLESLKRERRVPTKENSEALEKTKHIRTRGYFAKAS